MLLQGRRPCLQQAAHGLPWLPKMPLQHDCAAQAAQAAMMTLEGMRLMISASLTHCQQTVDTSKAMRYSATCAEVRSVHSGKSLTVSLWKPAFKRHTCTARPSRCILKGRISAEDEACKKDVHADHVILSS